MLIVRENMDLEKKLDAVPFSDFVIQESHELKEPLSQCAVPKLRYSTEGIDMDKSTHIFLKSENDLDAVCTLCASKAGQFNITLINAPTDFKSDESAYYNADGNVEDKYHRTKVIHWLHNRLSVAHELLDTSGIVILLVSESYIAEAKLLMQGIFGRDNEIITHILLSNKGGNISSGVRVQHQYVLVYAVDYQLTLDRIGVFNGKNRYFAVSKSIGTGLKQGQISPNFDKNSEKKLAGKFSDFQILSFIRAKSRGCNDKNYYPIYYIPAKSFNEDGVDTNPRLSLKPTGVVDEVAILPILDNGRECIWNNIPNTTEKRIQEGSLVVKSVNSQYKIFYKQYYDRDENNEIVEPVVSVLDGVSNLSTSVRMKEIFGKQQAYVGWHPDLINYLLHAYSKDGDTVAIINDTYWTAMTGILENNIDRVVYNVIPASCKEDTSYLSMLASTYKMQYMYFEVQQDSSECSEEFIDKYKTLQRSFLLLRTGALYLKETTDKYTIYETENYDLIVDLSIRFDLEVYREINSKLKSLKGEQHNKVYIYYIEDSEVAPGDDIISGSSFVNHLLFYNSKWNRLKRGLI